MIRRFIAATVVSAVASTVSAVALLTLIGTATTDLNMTFLQALFGVGSVEVALVGLPVSLVVAAVFGAIGISLSRRVPALGGIGVRVAASMVIGSAAFSACWAAILGGSWDFLIVADGAAAGGVGGIIFWLIYDGRIGRSVRTG